MGEAKNISAVVQAGLWIFFIHIWAIYVTPLVHIVSSSLTCREGPVVVWEVEYCVDIWDNVSGLQLCKQLRLS